ncbi:hypothetical protein [Streptomyces sp. NBC_01104]|uniref:hypothetical protein n=1 Tax=Streptomyces sp. NBC_01104 TaxID=2903750 RepID=UPI003868CAE9|nr:hypothetical protein OG450_00535 [Streptomyces sp. NBC_01104]
MIDARTHVVALSQQLDALATAPVDPALDAARNQLVDDCADHPAHARIGALLDHVLAHAASDGTEAGLLEEAAKMWTDGLALYAEIGRIRGEIETALSDPSSPGAASRFCEATLSLRRATSDAKDTFLRMDGLGKRLRTMAHIPRHPRQQNEPVSQWGWGDVFLARRTDALVRTAFGEAGTAETRALAFGILSGYSANAVGSVYLTQVVGGPRRSHRLRDRIARNAVGSWCGERYPDVRSCRGIADSLRFDNAPEATLPGETADFLTRMLEETYDLSKLSPVPDPALGYGRLIRQLELLDTFVQPPAPALPPASFVTKFFADPAHPPQAAVTPETATPPYAHGPGVKPTSYHGYGGGQVGPPTATDSTADSESACGSFCLAVLAFLCFAVLLGGPCWEEWGEEKSCTFWDKHVAENWRNAFTVDLSQAEKDALASQSQPLTGSGFAAAARVPQLDQLVSQLFDLHVRLWEALGKAGAFLSGCGLIYPDGRLGFPLHRQFLAVPNDTMQPHRPETDDVRTFYRYPRTEMENPVDYTKTVPVGADPGIVLTATGPDCVRRWEDVALGTPGDRNLDLDADRGTAHPCWSTRGSIDDDPVGVDILAYQDL